MKRIILPLALVLLTAGVMVFAFVKVFPFHAQEFTGALDVGHFVAAQEKLFQGTVESLGIIQDANGTQMGGDQKIMHAETTTLDESVPHTIPLDQIVDGGPPEDGIPSIDHPVFISIAAAGSFLQDDEKGIVVDLRGTTRFYPLSILVWHEIVNDTVGGSRVLVTYCPLSGAGIVFDPHDSEFGTSGRLWNSNLVMYDRKTRSWWSQITGAVIRGSMVGSHMDVLPSDVIAFNDFKQLYPHGEVLSTDTGVMRRYGTNPYGDYGTNAEVYFPVTHEDPRLPKKELVFGVVIDGKAKAYRASTIQKKGEITDHVLGKTIVARFEEDSAAVRLYEVIDGTRERIPVVQSYWFVWAAVHPNTELYK